jgi:hypothetical protein
LYRLKTGEDIDTKNINLDEASGILRKHFEQRGYTVHMVKFNPLGFSVYDLFKFLDKLIDAGWEIHALMIDYLELISGLTYGDKQDVKISNTADLTRAFCYPKGITVFNGHQLSTEAQKLAREGETGTFVKKVSTGGWYMRCQSLHTKFDLEFVQHIHQHIDGHSYLTVCRGKHRGGESTPIADQYFVQRFEGVRGLLFDAHLENPECLRSLPTIVDANTSNTTWED